MVTKRSNLPDLSPAQREIMEIVWERGEVTAQDVLRALSQTRDVARNTVRTLLERMEIKGWLKHRAAGRTFLYRPARARQATVVQKVREMVDAVCGGSAENLVAALLDARGLKREELDRIRQLLDAAYAQQRQKGGS